MLHVDIRKRLGSFSLDAQFTAENGTLALLGASGCGKSVTLKCIAGILRPDEGRIELDGRVLFDSAAKIDLPPQRREVGYLFQQYALFPNMTAAQNIAVAVKDRTKRDNVVAEKLRQFRLEDVAAKRPAALSGGQQQRTALARILASQPRAILLDEPFSALDSYLKYQLELELAETLSSFPGSVLWVTHDRGEAWRNCHKVCVMNGGKSQPVQTLEELFRSPGTESAARLSGCKNFTAAVPGAGTVLLPEWGISLSCGRAVPPETSVAGIRSHHVRFAAEGAENAFSCAVEKVIDDVFETIVLLRPFDAVQNAPLLRMELDKAAWAAHDGEKTVTVSVRPEDILLLERS
ncbi:sulfate/molybdate ABC transporter ATP-binding protein [Oscillibacter sp. GMB15532]|uniref:sulfate/molybdate ABC transporter ATP-binding protein n=1 Tax=Oscillibacter sp. GMB15532 TaxID=3230022 RepID=UPI0034DDED17